ncbi:carbohydrate kinase family protein [Candidatus Sumerlaeota bacterium]|nr:carbohydrate kinase family protein [Candidatus Sumerlaeota bacterium]
MTREIDAVIAGHICFDVIPTFPKGADKIADLLIPGTLVNMGEVTTSTGGPVSNTGIALNRLGMRTELMGKVGDDFFGEALLSRLRGIGMEEGMIVVPGEQTSYTIVIAPPGIDRMFLHCPGANNTFRADDIRLDVVESARLFHLGYPPLMEALFRDDGEQLAETFRRAKGTGATTSLDMSLPDPKSPSGRLNWRPVLERTLPHVDLFVPSAEEMLFMLHQSTYLKRKAEAKGADMLDFITPEDISWMAGECFEMGAKILLIKCGHRGIYCRTASEESLAEIGEAKPGPGFAHREVWSPSFHVENVAGATGSGDSSIAGFLASYLRGLPLEDCIRIANAVGGCNVTRPDALSGILTWDETLAKIDAGWKRNGIQVASAGWRFSAKEILWHGPKDQPV